MNVRQPDPTRVVVRIPGEMRGKGRPRFTRVGGFVRTYTDDRTETAENWIKACAVRAGIAAPLEGALRLDIEITVGIPKSWSKKKRAAAAVGTIRPTGKPDLDNSVKMIADALNKIAWRDDSQIAVLLAVKRYGVVPETVLMIERVGEAA